MSLANPRLVYCAEIWGGACYTDLQNLFVTQKNLLRIMYFGCKYEHTDPNFSNTCLLKLDDTITYCIFIFDYNALHSCPVAIEYSRMHHSINPRTLLMLRLPQCRMSHAQQCVLGVRLWNQLPGDTKNADTRNTFRARLKRELISRCLFLHLVSHISRFFFYYTHIDQCIPYVVQTFGSLKIHLVMIDVCQVVCVFKYSGLCRHDVHLYAGAFCDGVCSVSVCIDAN